MHARLRIAGLGLALTAGLLAIAPAGAAPAHTSRHGTFSETAAGAALGYDINGSAKLTVSAGSTVAKVNIAGLDPAKHYGSHVHNGTCASLGGGHYQNVEGGAAAPPNELWLSTTASPTGTVDPNRGGVGHASGSAPWAARLTSTTQTNARSIVVHEPVSGTRIACADLT